MFCDKYCVYIDICVFIIVKIKCVNLNRISDIYDKVTFTTKSNARDITYFTTK